MPGDDTSVRCAHVDTVVSALPAPEAGAPARLMRSVSSETLLRDGPLAIRHGDSIYYLRETRFGKLILTK